MHDLVEYLLKLVPWLPFLCEGHKHLIAFNTKYEFLSAAGLLNGGINLFALNRIWDVCFLLKWVDCVDEGPKR
jgi:hypothetical protein